MFTTSRQARTLLAAATTLIAAIALSACSSSARSSSGSTPPRTSSSPGGKPIVIATMGQFDLPQAGVSAPELPGAINARAAAVNHAGGIGGRPLKVVSCNIDSANAATTCANQAVDAGAVAIVGLFTPYDDQVMAVAEQHNIPVIGSIGASASLRSPVSFPITAGPTGAFWALPGMLNNAGAKKIAAAFPDVGGSGVAALVKLYSASAAAAKVANNGYKTVPATQPDMSPVAASLLANGTDGIEVALNGPQAAGLVQALGQQGAKEVIAGSTQSFNSNVVKSLGGQADGILVAAFTRPVSSSSPGTNLFRADMASYDSKLPTDDRSAAYWASAWLFERVAKQLPDVTSASIMTAMGKLNNFDMGGIVPNLTTTKPFTAFPNIPRLMNPYITLCKIKDGKLVLIDDNKPFINPFTGTTAP